MSKHWNLRFSICVFVLLLFSQPSFPLVRDVAIQIDGSFEDWAPVLNDPENYVTDLSEQQGDPDNPGSSDRDLRSIAVTWDSNNLYIYFRRTYSGSNSITFLLYADLDYNGVLDTNDGILRYDFNGATPGFRQFYAYVPSGAADPITGDGVSEPGGPGAGLGGSFDSDAAVSGIEFECSVSWNSLPGLDPGDPMNFHGAISTGMNLPSQVNDNADPIDTQFTQVDLINDLVRSGGPASTLSFPHTLRNDGNGDDTIDINAVSSGDRTIHFYSDPDGDGDHSDGALMGIDFNGDGDFSDPQDTAAIMDANGNSLPDSGLLPPGGTFSFVLDVVVPAGLDGNSEETMMVVARSGKNPNRFGRNEDLLVLGDLLASPDQSRISAVNVTINIPHTVYSNQSFEDTANLIWSSLLGWTVRVYSDPNGDGDPSDGIELADTNGDPLPDTGPIAAGGSFDLVVQIDVPPGAPLGVVDTINMVASSVIDPQVSDQLNDTVEVGERIEFTPDNVVDALPGDYVFLPHLLMNGQPFIDTFDLTYTPVLGSDVYFWTDPNQDGIIGDGQRITAADNLEDSGGELPLTAQVNLPMSAAIGTTEIVDLRALSQADPLVTGTATDTLNVVGCRTYANAIFSYPSSIFYRCATVYVKAGGLNKNDDYRFVWNDSNLGDGPERISPNYSADDEGELDDIINMAYEEEIGQWEVKVQIRAGSDWNDMPGYVYTYQVLDDLADAGVVDYLMTDKINYDQDGDSITVIAQLFNQSDIIYFRETSIEYTIFQDANHDRVPSVGDVYLQGNGTSNFWLPGSYTERFSPITLFPYQYFFDWFTISPAFFSRIDVWSVYCTWVTPCGTFIDDAIIDFDVGCSLGPVADAGLDQGICPGDSIQIGTPAEPDVEYSWSPGIDLDDPSIAQPTASPSATTVYAVTTTDPVTTCQTTDDVEVLVYPPPVPDVTPDVPGICAGESQDLDAGAGFTAYLWDTSETTQNITVSPATTTQYCVTVTDGNTCQEMSCETVTVHLLPTPDVTPDAPGICIGETQDLDAGAGYAAYQWDTGETTQTISVSPAATTQYCVSVTDSNGCEGSICETVAVYPRPNPDMTPNNPAICTGDSRVLDAGSGYTTYQWSTSDTTQTIEVSPSATTQYCVTVTNDDGCDETSCETVTVYETPTVVLAPQNPVVCLGQSVTLDAGAGHDSYLWSTGETTRQIAVSPSEETGYSCVVRNGDGCSATAWMTVNVMFPDPPESIGNTLKLVRNGTDIGALWGAEDSSVQYRLLRSTRKDLSDPVIEDTVPAGPDPVIDILPDPGLDLAFYRVIGVNCSQVPGP
ncbi:hypothetical protein ACFLU6_05675 [Acidobacteriota bacterium]